MFCHVWCMVIAREREIVERLERSVEREGRERGQVAVQAQGSCHSVICALVNGTLENIGGVPLSYCNYITLHT